MLTFVVKSVFFIIACLFWAVLGTLFWLALVFRALVAFSFAFLHAMFTKQDPASIQAPLEELTDLWFRGFRNAYGSVFSNLKSPATVEVRLGHLVAEIFWAMFFWVAFLSTWKSEEAISWYLRVVMPISRSVVVWLNEAWVGVSIVAVIVLGFVIFFIYDDRTTTNRNLKRCEEELRKLKDDLYVKRQAEETSRRKL